MANTFSLFKNLQLAAVAGMLLGGIDAAAQKSGEVALLTCYKIQNDHQKDIRVAFADYVSASLANEQNIMAEAYAEEQDSSIVWVIERWQNKRQLEAQRKTPAFQHITDLQKRNVMTQTKEVYVTDLEPLSKKEWRRTAGKDDRPITIMLFVDCKPGTQEQFKNTYHTAMPKFRSEPGVINYQLSQLNADETQFVTYEKFRNEAAFQYHLNFPPIQPVLDYLNTSIKAQPFQQGLHRLILLTPVDR